MLSACFEKYCMSLCRLQNCYYATRETRASETILSPELSTWPHSRRHEEWGAGASRHRQRAAAVFTFANPSDLTISSLESGF